MQVKFSRPPWKSEFTLTGISTHNKWDGLQISTQTSPPSPASTQQDGQTSPLHTGSVKTTLDPGLLKTSVLQAFSRTTQSSNNSVTVPRVGGSKQQEAENWLCTATDNISHSERTPSKQNAAPWALQHILSLGCQERHGLWRKPINTHGWNQDKGIQDPT